MGRLCVPGRPSLKSQPSTLTPSPAPRSGQRRQGEFLSSSPTTPLKAVKPAMGGGKGWEYSGNSALENQRGPKSVPGVATSQHLLAASGPWENPVRLLGPPRAAGCRLRGQPAGLGQPGPSDGHSTGITFSSACRPPAGPAPRRTGRRPQTPWCPSPSRQPGTTPCLRSQSHTPPCPLPPQPHPRVPCREGALSEVTQGGSYVVGAGTLALHVVLERTRHAKGGICVSRPAPPMCSDALPLPGGPALGRSFLTSKEGPWASVPLYRGLSPDGTNTVREGICYDMSRKYHLL